MTIFDWLERLEFLRGEPAAWLAALTAVVIVAAPDVRLMLLALAAHYFGAFLLFTEVLDPRLAVVKLLVGWFVCLIFYMTGRQINWGRPPVDLTPAEAAQWRERAPGRLANLPAPLWTARAGLAGLALLLAWWLAGRPNFYLPLLPAELAPLNLAVYALLALGLLQMALAEQPPGAGGLLGAGMGALLFLTGFALFYNTLDQSLIGLGLLAAVNLAVALAVSYLALARRNECVNSEL